MTPGPATPDALPVLYGHPLSRARIVRWLLEEIGCPYRVEVIDHRALPRPDWFLALNPMGKVPVLAHEGLVVTETPAICAYLADRYPEAGLAPPPEEAARGLYYRWLFFAAGPFEAATTNRRLGVDPAVEQRSFVGHGDLERVMRTLEQALERGPYLLGECLTAADLYLAAGLDFNTRLGLLRPAGPLAEYVSRLTNRPAAQRAKALDEADLARATS